MGIVLQFSDYHKAKPLPRFIGRPEYQDDQNNWIILCEIDGTPGALTAFGAVVNMGDWEESLNAIRFDTITESMDFIRYAEIHGVDRALEINRGVYASSHDAY